MSTATHHDAIPASRDRVENLALVHSQGDLSHHSITSQTDNQVFQSSLKARSDMSPPENHGFPPAHEVMHGMDSTTASKSDKSSVADKSPSPAPEAMLASAGAGTPEKSSKTEDTTEKSQSTEIVGTRHVESTLGNDTLVSRGVETTTHGTQQIDTIDARATAPVDQGQPQPQSVERPLPTRTDIG